MLAAVPSGRGGWPRAAAPAACPLGPLAAAALLAAASAAAAAPRGSPARSGLAFAGGGAAAGGARPPATAAPLPWGSERPRVRAGGAAGPSLAAGTASWSGLAAAACAWVAAKRSKSLLRRRAGASFNQTAVIPSGNIEPTLSDAERAAFLEKRCEGLRKLLQQTADEFEDEVDELTWQWARKLLPYVDTRRDDVASYKRRTILKQREFFEKMRLFKPLAMKYPTLLRRMNIRETPDIENRNLAIDADWIDNEEKIAGFTYEDFVTETKGNTFEDWEMPKTGELTSGIVVAMVPEGAFVEVGAKTWAFMPLANISLAPVSHPGEVLTVGEEIEAKVVQTGALSSITGDPVASQIILSMTDLQKVGAWDLIDATMLGQEGTEPILKVTVMQMRAWGAVVMTEQGLEGLIPNSQLADKVGDTSLVGQEIPVEILSADRYKETPDIKVKPGDFALTLSYTNAATKELANTLEEGQVVDAKVVMTRDASMDVEVRGTRCQMRKVDVSSSTRFNMADVFEVGEEIKCYVISTEKKSGAIRLSTRALEPRRGMMLTDKAQVFARAEDTARRYFERMSKEKAKTEDSLSDAVFGDALGDPTPKKKTGTIDIEDDEDDPLEF